MIAAAALGLSACGDDADDAAAPPSGEGDTSSSAAPASETLAIEATVDGESQALTIAESVPAGLVTLEFTNSDMAPRSAQFLRVEGDQTVDQVIEDVFAAPEGSPTPDYVRDGGGIGTVAPGETASASQVLAPGRYVVVDGDSGGENAPPAATGEFMVTGEPVEAELPEAPGRISAIDDGADEYGFEFEGLVAGENEVRFENTGQELHHALFFPIVGDATIDDVSAFIASEGQPTGPPPIDFERGTGTTVIDGGIAQNITIDLPAGRYATICFIADREGGPPHAALGMIEELTLE